MEPTCSADPDQSEMEYQCYYPLAEGNSCWFQIYTSGLHAGYGQSILRVVPINLLKIHPFYKLIQ